MSSMMARPNHYGGTLRDSRIARVLSLRVSDIVSFLLLSICFGLFFLPAEYAVSRTVFSLWQWMLLLVCIVTVLLYIKECPITMRWVSFSLFFILYYLISLVLASGVQNMSKPLFLCIKGIGFVSLVEREAKKDWWRCVGSFALGGMVVCSIHYYTYLKFGNTPGGIRHGVVIAGYLRATTQRWFFLTHDNGSVFYFLPTITALWIAEKRETRFPVLTVISVGLTTAMYIDLWSAAAMTVMLIFSAALAIQILFRDVRLPTPPYLVIISAFLVFSFVVIVVNASDLLSLVASRFGKEHTMSVRSMIWQNALRYISSHPLFGVGYDSGALTLMRIGINHCHNMFLQVLYTGGIVTLVAFVASFIYCTPLHGSQNEDLPILLLGFSLFLLVSVFDWYPHFTPQFMLPLMCCHCPFGGANHDR